MYKLNPILMKWNELCLPKGLILDFSFDEDALRLRSNETVDFIKHVLDLCDDTAGRFRKAAIFRFLMWFLLAYCTESILKDKHFLITTTKKIIEFRRETVSNCDMSSAFDDIILEWFLWFKATGSSVLPPQTYRELLIGLNKALCLKKGDVEDECDVAEEVEAMRREEKDVLEKEEMVIVPKEEKRWFSWLWQLFESQNKS